MTIILIAFLTLIIISHIITVNELHKIRRNQHEILNILDYILNDDEYYDEEQ